MPAFSLDFSKCTTHVTLEPPDPDFAYPDVIQHLHVRIGHPNRPGVLGYLKAILVDRDRCPMKKFHVVTAALEDQMSIFTDMFDGDGRLREKLVSHEYLRGTGCWGHDMDEHTIVYVEWFNVPAKVRVRWSVTHTTVLMGYSFAAKA